MSVQKEQMEGTDAGGYLRLFACALAGFKVVKIRKLNVPCGLKPVRDTHDDVMRHSRAQRRLPDGLAQRSLRIQCRQMTCTQRDHISLLV